MDEVPSWIPGTNKTKIILKHELWEHDPFFTNKKNCSEQLWGSVKRGPARASGHEGEPYTQLFPTSDRLGCRRQRDMALSYTGALPARSGSERSQEQALALPGGAQKNQNPKQMGVCVGGGCFQQGSRSYSLTFRGERPPTLCAISQTPNR